MVITEFGTMPALRLVDLPEITIVKDLVLEEEGPDSPFLKASNERFPPTLVNLVNIAFEHAEETVLENAARHARGEEELPVKPEVGAMYFLGEDAKKISRLLGKAAFFGGEAANGSAINRHCVAAQMMIDGALRAEVPAVPHYHPLAVAH